MTPSEKTKIAINNLTDIAYGEFSHIAKNEKESGREELFHMWVDYLRKYHKYIIEGGTENFPNFG